MAIAKYLISFCLLVFTTHQGLANYTIKGTINITDEWQSLVFLASVNKLDDYYNTSPDLIVEVGIIEDDGSFTIQGNNLPEESKFYRLYLMKQQNSEFDACFYFGEDHNFIHLVLNNSSELEVMSDPDYNSPFGNYSIKGNHDNHMMRELSKIVHPSFYFYQIKFPSELRFSEEKLNKDLNTFADTCQSTIASLAAVVNTDFDRYFDTNTAFYLSFEDRIKSDLTANSYVNDYHKKIKYYLPESEGESSWKNILIGLLSLSTFLLIGYTLYLRKTVRNQASRTKKSREKLDQLTQKETEIFNLIVSGKSNKDIANELFIELSTVKTHINKIYSKLDISDRKGAKTYEKSQ